MKKETINAKAVNNPKRTVGVKFERAKIENPAAIVVAGKKLPTHCLMRI